MALIIWDIRKIIVVVVLAKLGVIVIQNYTLTEAMNLLAMAN